MARLNEFAENLNPVGFRAGRFFSCCNKIYDLIEKSNALCIIQIYGNSLHSH